MVILILFFSILRASGQNEFASTAFYKDFQKIYSDAQKGFPDYKGKKKASEFEELVDEYQVKLMLPLADSGKIVIPASGLPYAVYFFEPDKNRLKVDQRGANLRDAVLISLGQQLYARTETTTINNKPLSNTWYFTEPNETKLALAAFRLSIYYQDGKYNLSFEIRGKSINQ
jgi:hypothetical protein